MSRLGLLLILLAVAASGLGCARVPMWERSKHASPAMLDPFASDPMGPQYRSKVVETVTAGGLPGDAPGGGCGCTQ